MVKVLAKMRIAPRGLRFESVGAEEVGARLGELALGAPAGRVADLAGPQVREIADMVRAFDAARGRTRTLLPIRLPGAIGRAYRAGANLADETAIRGRGTWEDFLTAQFEWQSAREPLGRSTLRDANMRAQ